MRTFYVSLHVEKADEALHGAHPAWVRPEYGAKSEPGLVRTYLIKENVYFLKDWLKSGFGEKYLRARDVGSRWDQIVLPTAALLHHGKLWVYSDEAAARRAFERTANDEPSRDRSGRILIAVQAFTVRDAAKAALQSRGVTLLSTI